MNKQRRKTVTLALLMLASPLAFAAADPLQAHDSIREAARQHVLNDAAQFPSQPKVEVGKLDSRLRLVACDRPLESYDSPNGLSRGRGVVGVRCTGSKPWKIYVPVKVALIEAVVVSSRALVRGQSLQTDDLMLKEMDVSRLHKAYFTRIEDVVGLRSKRSVSAGSTLHAGLLQREKLVKRGAQVEIVALGDGLHVRMQGKALADGGRGDRIKVKNLNSGRVITGTVAGAGMIQVLH